MLRPPLCFRSPWILSCLVLACALARAEEEVALTIDPDRLENRIEVGIYGQFLEHIFNSVHGGLWGDMLLNGSLQPAAGPRAAGFSAPDYWQCFGAAEFANDVRDAFSEATALGIRRQQPLGEAGLRQRPKSLRRGERYRGSVYLKGKAAGGMCVRLVDESGKVLCRADLRDIGPQWQKHAFQFVAPANVASAAMEIALPGRGDVRIDCLSLFSQSALDCGGFRPDLLQAIAALKPASIRYPGGCFASAYRWKDAVGPREKRKYCPASLWADRDSNQFGSDEFLLLCRKVGAEPVLVVNATRGIQETLDWIEYCNGEQGTTWGKRRADNGHPGPYRVKFWEIDNEAWPQMTAKAYAKIVTTFSRAIRAKDPALRIIACGGSDYDNGQSPQGKSYTDG